MALETVAGVRAVRVDLARGGVDVEHDGDGVDLRALNEALEAAVLLPRGRRMIEAFGAALRRGRGSA